MKKATNGSYESPVDLIKLIMDMMSKEYNIFMRNSTIRISLMPELLHRLQEDIEGMLEYDVNCISIYPVLSIDPEEKIWDLDKLQELTDSINEVSVYAIENTRTNIQTLEYVNEMGFGCGAGVTSVYVNAKGSVYGCFYTAQEEKDYDLLANFLEGKIFPNKHITTGAKADDPKCQECDKEYCLMCYANNMETKGDMFCSAAWCQEAIDFYQNTLPLCDLSVLNSQIATTEDGNADILNSINSELYDISNYIQAIAEGDTSFRPDTIGISRVEDSRVNWMSTLNDLDSIKDSLKMLMLNMYSVCKKNKRAINNE